MNKDTQWYNEQAEKLKAFSAEAKMHFPYRMFNGIRKLIDDSIRQPKEHKNTRTWHHDNGLYKPYENIEPNVKYSYTSKRILNEDLDLLEQYIQMYIECLPFTFGKYKKLNLTDICSFDLWIPLYKKGFYQHRIFKAELILEGENESRILSIYLKPKFINDTPLFIPDFPHKSIVLKTWSCVYFCGQKINIITN